MSQIPQAAPYLTIEDRKMLMKHNDGYAVLEIIFHLALLIGAFAVIYFYPKVYVIIPMLFIIGGQQLACAVLMHDSSHHAILSSKKWNDFIGRWIGGYLLFNSMENYRTYHKLHHITTGTTEDPDLLLTRGYPTSKKSMLRKFSRDLFGITGMKAFVALIAMHLGYLQYTQSGDIVKVDPSERKVDIRPLLGAVVANACLFILLATLFDPRIYIFWLLAYFSTFQFCVRVRAMAEHSVVEDPTDPLKNTRTTYANIIERLLFAPYHVNYHLEHHMLMTVPSYNLPKMHKLLKERGFYEHGLLAKNYWEIVKNAASQ